jgi:hypothetical protein
MTNGGSSATGQERRAHRRWPIALGVCEIDPEEHVRRATSISANGLYLPSELPRPIGSRLVLEIELPNAESPLRVQCRVIHNGHDNGFGVGVQFDAPHPVLAAYLDGLGSALSQSQNELPRSKPQGA